MRSGWAALPEDGPREAGNPADDLAAEHRRGDQHHVGEPPERLQRRADARLGLDPGVAHPGGGEVGDPLGGLEADQEPGEAAPVVPGEPDPLEPERVEQRDDVGGELAFS